DRLGRPISTHFRADPWPRQRPVRRCRQPSVHQPGDLPSDHYDPRRGRPGDRRHELDPGGQEIADGHRRFARALHPIHRDGGRSERVGRESPPHRTWTLQRDLPSTSGHPAPLRLSRKRAKEMRLAIPKVNVDGSGTDVTTNVAVSPMNGAPWYKVD